MSEERRNKALKKATVIVVALFLAGILVMLSGAVVANTIEGSGATLSDGDSNSGSRGEPVPGADIFIEQEPDDEPVAFTLADVVELLAQNKTMMDFLKNGSTVEIIIVDQTQGQTSTQKRIDVQVTIKIGKGTITKGVGNDEKTNEYVINDISIVSADSTKLVPMPTPDRWVPEESMWHRVGMFEGDYSDTTSTFKISSEKWRVLYNIKPDSGRTYYSEFGAHVHRADDTHKLFGTFYCNKEPCRSARVFTPTLSTKTVAGEFYIEVESKNNLWALTIEEYY